MDKYRIDYSKWDRFVDSDDEDENERGPVKPRVAVLGQPTQITFGGGEGQQSDDLEEAEEVSSPSAESKINTAIPLSSNVSELCKTKPLSQYGIPASWSEKGAVIPRRPDDDAPRFHTSLQDIHYCWSQDRATVHIRIPMDRTTAAKEYDVSVSNMLPYRDRHCAVLTNAAPPQLVVRHKSDTVLLNGTLSHPVYITDEDDGVVDWSIETVRLGDSEGRYILILLNKATPMDGVTLWWKQCLQDERVHAELPPATPQQVALQEAWTEAHAQFRESVATRTKHTL